MWVRNFNPEIHHRRSIRIPDYNYSRPGFYFITLCCSYREYLFGEIKDNIMILNDFGRIAYDEWIQSAKIRSEIELDEFVVMPNHFHAIVLINIDGRKVNNSGRGDRPVAPTDSNNPVAPTDSNNPVAPTDWAQNQLGDPPVAPTDSNNPVTPTDSNNPVAPTDWAQNQLGDPPVAPTRPTGPKSKSIGSLMAGYKSSVTKKINQLRHKPGEPVWQRNYFEHIIRDEKSLAQIRQYILDNPENWGKDEFYR